jgi:hypothetical protein
MGRKGVGHSDKAVMPDPEKAIEAMATRFVQNGQLGIRVDKQIGAPTEEDRRHLTRITGMTADEFNAKLSAKLQVLSDKIAKRIEEKIDENAFKPGELPFAFSVMEDKRARLDGRNGVNNAQINVQVNNYGDRSRDEIIGSLFGNKGMTLNVTGAQDVI